MSVELSSTEDRRQEYGLQRGEQYSLCFLRLSLILSDLITATYCIIVQC